MTSHQRVQRVEEGPRPERSEHASQGTGPADFGEERDGSSAIAGNERAIAEDEPPAFPPRFLGHGCEQAVGLLIGQWQQGEFFVPVESGDDTRRPAAEPSAAGVEQDRARNSRHLRLGLVARMVDPIAPNFFALRRVSSEGERANVSTSSPWAIST
jgi:hypothetical protein